MTRLVGALWLGWWVSRGLVGGCPVARLVGVPWLGWWVSRGLVGGCPVAWLVGVPVLGWWVSRGLVGGCPVARLVGVYHIQRSTREDLQMALEIPCFICIYLKPQCLDNSVLGTSGYQLPS